MNKRIITISREFGSGGRTVGKEVAKRLGYAYYDKELIAEIAKESGFSEEFISERSEYATVTNSFLFNLAIHAGSTGGGTLPISDQLYVIQHNLIKEIAEKENCIIVGRCADYILRDRSDCLHTFFYADEDFRMERIVRLYGDTGISPQKRLKEKDDRRKIYYKHYTGRQWGVIQNYHIALNSSVIGIEKCADIVVRAVLDETEK